MLTESLIYPGNDGKSHLRERTVTLNTQCWRYGYPCTAEMK